MPQQPEFPTHPLPASPLAGTPAQPGTLPFPAPAPPVGPSHPAISPHNQPPQRIPRWLERAELFLRVLLRIYIGLAVSLAPWFPIFWDQNPFFLQFPTLFHYAATGVVRGLVSGLGLLNLWIAFQDAIRHGSEKS